MLGMRRGMVAGEVRTAGLLGAARLGAARAAHRPGMSAAAMITSANARAASGDGEASLPSGSEKTRMPPRIAETFAATRGDRDHRDALADLQRAGGGIEGRDRGDDRDRVHGLRIADVTGTVP